MRYREVPHFIIKNPMNKTSVTGKVFGDEVTVSVLEDVCYRITGLRKFTYDYVDSDYQDEFVPKSFNKGRTAILLYEDTVSYISFSEQEISGRNSSIQSVPTAFNLYFNNQYPKKKLYYYFLDVHGNAETEYQIMIYRLMNTIGFEFLNANIDLRHKIHHFTSIEDIIFNRKINSGRNRSNNSTFITKGNNGEVEIYGKTYGASKYETSLICYAISYLCEPWQTIKLYEVLEGNLKELPKASLSVIERMGAIELSPTATTVPSALNPTE